MSCRWIGWRRARQSSPHTPTRRRQRETTYPADQRVLAQRAHLPPRNVEDLRSPVDWLTDMSLISAGGMAETGGYIGYMKAYATAHEALDEDKSFQEEELAISHLGQICLSFSDSDPKIIRTLIPRFDMALVKTSRIAGSA